MRRILIELTEKEFMKLQILRAKSAKGKIRTWREFILYLSTKRRTSENDNDDKDISGENI
jgi:hypothetical protein